jgi:hypothetical protein
MNRIQLRGEDWDQVMSDFTKILKTAISDKGNGALHSSHEIVGYIKEELDEMCVEVRKRDKDRIVSELYDIAMASIHGIASILYGEAEIK